MMTLRQMRYFEALATTRHFGRAAELVHVSQPALSAQIVELERHLGIKLVERGRRVTVLTEDGEALLPQIRQILGAVEKLETGTRQNAAVLSGRLRLGIIPTVAPYLVPVLVPHLREAYPQLDIELKETMTQTLLDDLHHGQIDAIIAALPIEEEGLETRLLFRDRFLIASAQDETTVLMSPITQDQVDLSRLLLLEEGHCMRDQALAVCDAGATGRRLVNYGATSMATLLEMVSHGLGLTLIPEISVKAESSRRSMRIVPFAEPQPAREIGLVTRLSSNRAADFDAFAKAVSTCTKPLLMD